VHIIITKCWLYKHIAVVHRGHIKVGNRLDKLFNLFVAIVFISLVNTDLQSIISRFSRGDSDVLNARQAVYQRHFLLHLRPFQ